MYCSFVCLLDSELSRRLHSTVDRDLLVSLQLPARACLNQAKWRGCEQTTKGSLVTVAALADSALVPSSL